MESLATALGSNRNAIITLVSSASSAAFPSSKASADSGPPSSINSRLMMRTWLTEPSASIIKRAEILPLIPARRLLEGYFIWLPVN